MSGEFTPTTKQVRDGYRYDPEAEYHDPITPHHVTNGRAFDAWYAAEIAAAKAEAWDECAYVAEKLIEDGISTLPDERLRNPYRKDPS